MAIVIIGGLVGYGWLGWCLIRGTITMQTRVNQPFRRVHTNHRVRRDEEPGKFWLYWLLSALAVTFGVVMAFLEFA